MSETYHVDPDAMATAAGLFAETSGSLSVAHDAAGAVQFRAGSAYYMSYGTDYQNAYRQMIKNLLPPMTTKSLDVGTALDSSGTSYTDQDTAAAKGITSAGAGA